MGMKNRPPPLEQADSVYGAGDFEGALRLYLETFDELGAEPRPSSGRARALAGVGNCYELLDRKGRAVSFWHRALGELRRCGQGESAAAALLENAIESHARPPAAFISYARQDEPQAEPLERLLHQRGCRLVRDVRDFRPG